jgi:hypothetical protein
MPAKWSRINPVQLTMPGKGKFAIMLMATAAKKHVTIFSRSRFAPGAGAPQTKAAFTAAAHKTIGIQSRQERNQIVKQGTMGQGPGMRTIKSRSKASPGKVIRQVPTR